MPRDLFQQPGLEVGNNGGVELARQQLAFTWMGGDQFDCMQRCARLRGARAAVEGARGR